MKEVETFIGPCSKFVDGQGWTTEIPVEQLKAKGYHKELQLPTKCWVVDWVLGWGMTEYKVTRAYCDCISGKILTVYCESRSGTRLFHTEDLSTAVFFDEREASAYLKKKEKEGDDGF